MTIKLSDGTEFYVGGAGDCILGISAGLIVTEGYDTAPDRWPNEPDEECQDDAGYLTPAQCIEVCDVMIDRWQRLRERFVQTKTPAS